MYLVYILTSDNLSYVGMTNNFERRIRQHNREIKGGAKYTSKKSYWYPICIIDGFLTMKEAMQCEWAIKHCKYNKIYKGSINRVINVNHLLTKEKWTSNSPTIKHQSLNIYIDSDFKEYINNNEFIIKELYWKL
jgi:predicted GIY-YIG superfamily endonuclease